ncbi:hypothetical protein BESB_000170 [Besnoitia besnoiti]|uniref:Trafficking protein particle complex subunit 11 domain-containing protein n=1 Tax=Besnoitia besnoiti TaxID=94643 RepID=A0A2A9MI67_BESBE|nr:hypothetical protein BESB_000170 [Besnoitia besnoiti]PFH37675.1 hypothetical protein BESB_000170 [Besnoitia besnoiti]
MFPLCPPECNVTPLPLVGVCTPARMRGLLRTTLEACTAAKSSLPQRPRSNFLFFDSEQVIASPGILSPPRCSGNLVSSSHGGGAAGRSPSPFYSGSLPPFAGGGTSFARSGEASRGSPSGSTSPAAVESAALRKGGHAGSEGVAVSPSSAAAASGAPPYGAAPRPSLASEAGENEGFPTANDPLGSPWGGSGLAAAPPLRDPEVTLASLRRPPPAKKKTPPAPEQLLNKGLLRHGWLRKQLAEKPAAYVLCFDWREAFADPATAPPPASPAAHPSGASNLDTRAPEAPIREVASFAAAPAPATAAGSSLPFPGAQPCCKCCPYGGARRDSAQRSSAGSAGGASCSNSQSGLEAAGKAVGEEAAGSGSSPLRPVAGPLGPDEGTGGGGGEGDAQGEADLCAAGSLDCCRNNPCRAGGVCGAQAARLGRAEGSAELKRGGEGGGDPEASLWSPPPQMHSGMEPPAGALAASLNAREAAIARAEAAALALIERVRERVHRKRLAPKMILFVILPTGLSDPQGAVGCLRRLNPSEIAALFVTCGIEDIQTKMERLEQVAYDCAVEHYENETRRYRKQIQHAPKSADRTQANACHVYQARSLVKAGYMLEFAGQPHGAMKSFIAAWQLLTTDKQMATAVERMSLCNLLSVRMYHMYFQAAEPAKAAHHAREHRAVLRENPPEEEELLGYLLPQWLAELHELLAHLQQERLTVQHQKLRLQQASQQASQTLSAPAPPLLADWGGGRREREEGAGVAQWWARGGASGDEFGATAPVGLRASGPLAASPGWAGESPASSLSQVMCTSPSQPGAGGGGGGLPQYGYADLLSLTTEAWENPGFHFQAAARYLQELRVWVRRAKVQLRPPSMKGGLAVSAEWVGQLDTLQHGVEAFSLIPNTSPGAAAALMRQEVILRWIFSVNEQQVAMHATHLLSKAHVIYKCIGGTRGCPTIACQLADALFDSERMLTARQLYATLAQALSSHVFSRASLLSSSFSSGGSPAGWSVTAHGRGSLAAERGGRGEFDNAADACGRAIKRESELGGAFAALSCRGGDRWPGAAGGRRLGGDGETDSEAERGDELEARRQQLLWRAQIAGSEEFWKGAGRTDGLGPGGDPQLWAMRNAGWWPLLLYVLARLLLSICSLLSLSPPPFLYDLAHVNPLFHCIEARHAPSPLSHSVTEGASRGSSPRAPSPGAFSRLSLSGSASMFASVSSSPDFAGSEQPGKSLLLGSASRVAELESAAAASGPCGDGGHTPSLEVDLISGSGTKDLRGSDLSLAGGSRDGRRPDLTAQLGSGVSGGGGGAGGEGAGPATLSVPGGLSPLPSFLDFENYRIGVLSVFELMNLFALRADRDDPRGEKRRQLPSFLLLALLPKLQHLVELAGEPQRSPHGGDDYEEGHSRRAGSAGASFSRDTGEKGTRKPEHLACERADDAEARRCEKRREAELRKRFTIDVSLPGVVCWLSLPSADELHREAMALWKMEDERENGPSGDARGAAGETAAGPGGSAEEARTPASGGGRRKRRKKQVVQGLLCVLQRFGLSLEVASRGFLATTRGPLPCRLVPLVLSPDESKREEERARRGGAPGGQRKGPLSPLAAPTAEDAGAQTESSLHHPAASSLTAETASVPSHASLSSRCAPAQEAAACPHNCDADVVGTCAGGASSTGVVIPSGRVCCFRLIVNPSEASRKASFFPFFPSASSVSAPLRVLGLSLTWRLCRFVSFCLPTVVALDAAHPPPELETWQAKHIQALHRRLLKAREKAPQISRLYLAPAPDGTVGGEGVAKAEESYEDIGLAFEGSEARERGRPDTKRLLAASSVQSAASPPPPQCPSYAPSFGTLLDQLEKASRGCWPEPVRAVLLQKRLSVPPPPLPALYTGEDAAARASPLLFLPRRTPPVDYRPARFFRVGLWHPRFAWKDESVPFMLRIAVKDPHALPRHVTRCRVLLFATHEAAGAEEAASASSDLSQGKSGAGGASADERKGIAGHSEKSASPCMLEDSIAKRASLLGTRAEDAETSKRGGQTSGRATGRHAAAGESRSDQDRQRVEMSAFRQGEENDSHEGDAAEKRRGREQKPSAGREAEGEGDETGRSGFTRGDTGKVEEQAGGDERDVDAVLGDASRPNEASSRLHRRQNSTASGGPPRGSFESFAGLLGKAEAPVVFSAFLEEGAAGGEAREERGRLAAKGAADERAGQSPGGPRPLRRVFPVCVPANRPVLSLDFADLGKQVERRGEKAQASGQAEGAATSHDELPNGVNATERSGRPFHRHREPERRSTPTRSRAGQGEAQTGFASWFPSAKMCDASVAAGGCPECVSRAADRYRVLGYFTGENGSGTTRERGTRGEDERLVLTRQPGEGSSADDRKKVGNERSAESRCFLEANSASSFFFENDARCLRGRRGGDKNAGGAFSPFRVFTFRPRASETRPAGRGEATEGNREEVRVPPRSQIWAGGKANAQGDAEDFSCHFASTPLNGQTGGGAAAEDGELGVSGAGAAPEGGEELIAVPLLLKAKAPGVVQIRVVLEFPPRPRLRGDQRGLLDGEGIDEEEEDAFLDVDQQDDFLTAACSIDVQRPLKAQLEAVPFASASAEKSGCEEDACGSGASGGRSQRGAPEEDGAFGGITPFAYLHLANPSNVALRLEDVRIVPLPTAEAPESEGEDRGSQARTLEDREGFGDAREAPGERRLVDAESLRTKSRACRWRFCPVCQCLLPLESTATEPTGGAREARGGEREGRNLEGAALASPLIGCLATVDRHEAWSALVNLRAFLARVAATEKAGEGEKIARRGAEQSDGLDLQAAASRYAVCVRFKRKVEFLPYPFNVFSSLLEPHEQVFPFSLPALAAACVDAAPVTVRVSHVATPTVGVPFKLEAVITNHTVDPEEATVELMYPPASASSAGARLNAVGDVGDGDASQQATAVGWNGLSDCPFLVSGVLRTELLLSPASDRVLQWTMVACRAGAFSVPTVVIKCHRGVSGARDSVTTAPAENGERDDGAVAEQLTRALREAVEGGNSSPASDLSAATSSVFVSHLTHIVVCPNPQRVG